MQVAMAVVAVDELSSSDSEVSTMALYKQMEELSRNLGTLRTQLVAHTGDKAFQRPNASHKPGKRG